MYIALRHENIKRSNRTFMELKHRTYQGISTKYQRSNRTFMELKPYSVTPEMKSGRVLIVPLWN